jgi:hypothetical protein
MIEGEKKWELLRVSPLVWSVASLAEFSAQLPVSLG